MAPLHPSLLLLITVMLVVCAPVRAGADDIAVRVTAEVSADGAEVTGTATLRFTNQGPAPLHELVLLLYAHRFEEVEPELNDLTYPRVYPRRFSPGDLRLPGVETTPVAREGDPEGTWVSLPLDAPLPPGETVEIALPFATTVPRRHGTFGRHRDVVALNGGWLPQVVARDDAGRWTLDAPLPVADWDVVLHHDPGWGATINGLAGVDARVGAGAPGHGTALFSEAVVHYRGRGRFVTVVLHQGQQVTAVDSANGPLTYVGRPPTRRQQQDLQRVAEAAFGLLREAGADHAAGGTVVVEVPLRWRLVELGEGCVLVSDRLLEADPHLRRSHQTQLARGLLTDQLLEVAERIERPAEAPAVAEAVAWSLIPRYLASRYRFNPTAQDLLRPLDFLPSVEQFLYAPRYPFADEVLNNPYQYDPLRADIRRLHRSGISPRVSAMKVRDHVGPLVMDSAAVDWVGGHDGRFLASLERRSGLALHPTWEAWERTLPFANYHLQVQRQRLDDGWLTTIELQRQLPADVPAPAERVEVRATVPATRHEPRERLELAWDGDGDGASWQLHTPRRVRRVEVDPRQQLLEIDPEGFVLRHDNQRPLRLKVYPWGSVGSIDVGNGTFSGQVGLSGRTAFDNRNLASASAYHNAESMVGVGLGYYRYFGRSRDALYLRNRVGLSMALDLLNPYFAAVEGRLPVGGTVWASYRFNDQFGGLFPTRGGSLFASVHTGRTWWTDLPGDAASPHYWGASVTGEILMRLHPHMVLGWRGKAGFTTADLPHLQHTLGGVSNVRGLPAHQVTGHTKLFTGLEWRILLLRDMDLRLPLGRLRAVQLNLFGEGGWVGDGAPTVDGAHVGAGAGLRFHFAYLGIWPAVGGIDVAWSPRASEGNLLPLPIQIYVVMGQTF